MTSGTIGIGELARVSGVPATTIRYYDRIGLVSPVGRVGDKRRFTEAAVRRLTAISMCTQAGFTLDEVRVLLLDTSPDRTDSRALAHRKLIEIEQRQRELQAARTLIERGMRCTCPALDTCDCGA